MFLLYFFLWIIFNGRFTLEIAIFGIVISSVVFWFTCKFLDYSIAKELHNMKKIFVLFRYIGLLIIEIIKANYATLHLILTQKEEIEPVLATFQSDLKTPAGKTLLANAITLTPGTITVKLEDNTYVVHCLDKDMAEGLIDNPFEKLAAQLEEQ